MILFQDVFTKFCGFPNISWNQNGRFLFNFYMTVIHILIWRKNYAYWMKSNAFIDLTKNSYPIFIEKQFLWWPIGSTKSEMTQNIRKLGQLINYLIQNEFCKQVGTSFFFYYCKVLLVLHFILRKFAVVRH